MKTIEIKVYEFDELSAEAKNRALWDQAQFEVNIMDENSPFLHEALRMEKMQTPWFLGEVIRFDHEQELIETIKANNYLFLASGEFYE